MADNTVTGFYFCQSDLFSPIHVLFLCCICLLSLLQSDLKGGIGMANMDSAYFAGGCFWCITPTFRKMEGVADVVSGYSGGEEENPVYEDVKYQRTGHRETIQIGYDPERVSFQ